MKFAGSFRTVRRSDKAVPELPPRSLLGKGAPLDIRIWRHGGEEFPLLLVNASRKQGPAVQRNRFRRRVRMAFLEVMRECPASIPRPAVIWIRPAKGRPKACQISYAEISGQLRKALNRWEPR